MGSDTVRALAVGLVTCALAACSRDARFDNLTPQQEEGYNIYRRDCAACHNMNASFEGTQGPPIAGSSLELLEARVLRLQYPKGYTPKRDTKLMNPPMPYLKDKIPALHAFLDPALHPAK